MKDYFIIKSYRCRVCNIAVAYTQFANKNMVRLEVCYEHWKNMI